MTLSYQHIRNATAKLNYAGVTFLIDPYLAEAERYAGFEGTVNSHLRNPRIAMPCTIDELLKGVDAIIVTHTHDDHWDEVAQEQLPKDLPIFVQNPGDARIIREQGFSNVQVMGNHTPFNNVRLTRIKGGQHGPDEMYSIPMLAEISGDAMGVIFQAEGEKTLYIVGDTIFNTAVEQTLTEFQPEIIVMNTGYARLPMFEKGIIMGLDDVTKMAEIMPNAQLITVHMDAVNHTTVSSTDMRNYIAQHQLKQIAVPKEGEVLVY